MLYAIGDTHLSFEAGKPMDVFGGGWNNYIDKLIEGFSVLKPDDVCVICGDITWGMSIEKCLADFKFLNDLPGKKIILKGNHDFWWTTASKTKKFFDENGIDKISVLNNNCFFYEDVAICGTRGWFYEEEVHTLHDKKIMNRELIRLETSLKAAGECEKKLCFFHYPPRFNNYICREIIDVMKKYGVERCWYGHIHSHGHKFAVQGNVDGIEYNMVSADYINFRPVKIM